MPPPSAKILSPLVSIRNRMNAGFSSLRIFTSLELRLSASAA